jgi:hypothetical protein
LRSLAFLAISAAVLFYAVESKGFEDCIRNRDNEERKKESGPLLVFIPRSLTCTVRVFDKHNGALVALFTLTLWVTTQATLAHLRREFDAEHRPWMGVTVEYYRPFEFKPDGTGFVYLKLGFTNTGRVPATNVRSRYEIVPPNGNPVAAQRRIAQEMMADNGKATEYGNSVFARLPATQNVHYDLSAGAVAEWRAWREKNPSLIDTTYVHVAGCATYGSPLSKAKHQTGFIRELHRADYQPIDPKEGTSVSVVTSGSILGSGQID